MCVCVWDRERERERERERFKGVWTKHHGTERKPMKLDYDSSTYLYDSG